MAICRQAGNPELSCVPTVNAGFWGPSRLTTRTALAYHIKSAGLYAGARRTRKSRRRCQAHLDPGVGEIRPEV